MTREEAIKEIKKVFEPAFANYIITALTEGATVSDKEPTTKNDLPVDSISRTQAQTEIEMNASRYTIAKERGGMGQVEWSDQLIKVSDAVDIIRNLPSVTPQEPKTGQWVKTPKAVMGEGYMWYCDRCKHQIYQDSSRPYPSENYCPNCGTKMIEPQESEDVEAVKDQLPLCEDVIHGDFTGVIL